MENKKPINIFNGLKIEIKNDDRKDNVNESKSRLVAVNAFQNSRNITKPFIKPISKII